MLEPVRLVIVTGGENSPDPARVKFKRSDTGKETSCIDCESFTDDAKCSRGLAFCWPLGCVCCSEWKLRTVEHATKPCAECGCPMPKYLTNRARCGAHCDIAHELGKAYDSGKI